MWAWALKLLTSKYVYYALAAGGVLWLINDWINDTKREIKDNFRSQFELVAKEEQLRVIEERQILIQKTQQQQREAIDRLDVEGETVEKTIIQPVERIIERAPEEKQNEEIPDLLQNTFDVIAEQQGDIKSEEVIEEENEK